MKQSISRLCIILFLLLLLIFPSASVQGASRGLLLWFNTVLPTLLPFLIVSNLLISLNIAENISRFFGKTIPALLHLSECGIYALVVGVLCGYPMGAKAICDLINTKKINLKEGRYLLAFCCYPSPMFLTGYVVAQKLKLNNQLPFLAGIYLPALVLIPLSFFLTFRLHLTDEGMLSAMDLEEDSQQPPRLTLKLFESCMMNAFEIIVKIGGYMILFSILGSFVLNLDWMNNTLRLALLGAAEMTTGVDYVSASAFSLRLKCVFCGAFVSFGGLSGLAQTASVLKNCDLKNSVYIFWKLIHGMLTAGLLWIFY